MMKNAFEDLRLYVGQFKFGARYHIIPIQLATKTLKEVIQVTSADHPYKAKYGTKRRRPMKPARTAKHPTRFYKDLLLL
jgi:hypothetical protein